MRVYPFITILLNSDDDVTARSLPFGIPTPSAVSPALCVSSVACYDATMIMMALLQA